MGKRDFSNVTAPTMPDRSAPADAPAKKDEKGNELFEGQRVYVPPQPVGGPRSGMFPEPIFDRDTGEPIMKASVRGRIMQFHWSTKHECWAGETTEGKLFWVDNARLQRGKTKAEKTLQQGQRRRR